jgi:hypothetical protein
MHDPILISSIAGAIVAIIGSLTTAIERLVRLWLEARRERRPKRRGQRKLPAVAPDQR